MKNNTRRYHFRLVNPLLGYKKGASKKKIKRLTTRYQMKGLEDED